MKLNLYAIFHLNLAFSSIETEQRSEVVKRCYWPLLKLIKEQQLPLGIEACGYTLEEINRLDPDWIAQFKSLCHEGPAEFVGSGYVQLIGPLVPAEVNHWNQQLGLQVYRQLLDLQPSLALVSEQAYSAGLIEHYLAAGYRGIVMEWDNPSNGREDWQPEWRYLPQRAKGLQRDIPLLWNKSLPFQQFQRYGHGEIELEEYFETLEKHLSDGPRVFSLYGNDAEIFDFRPGRFQTESRLQQNEWQRLAELFTRLQQDRRFQLIAPSKALDFLDRPGAGRTLELQSARQPVPVKKQAKYNITRWAVTGRDDLRINSACHRIHRCLLQTGGDEQQWRELCYLWSSDFRTHITEKRWHTYLLRLEKSIALCSSPPAEKSTNRRVTELSTSAFQVFRQERFLEIHTPTQRIKLNLRRGLAIDSLTLNETPELSLLGTLRHGYFDDISLGADFYTGHLVVEIPGDHKLTDLQRVEPELFLSKGALVVAAELETALGTVEKRLIIPADEAGISFCYRFHWQELPTAAVRLGHITLNPTAFNRHELYFAAHNGGDEMEPFMIGAEPIDHLSGAGSLVSASQGIGITAGLVEIGDRQRTVRIETDPAKAALTGHIFFQPTSDSYLYRLIFSAREIDDTCSQSRNVSPSMPDEISFQISFPAAEK